MNIHGEKQTEEEIEESNSAFDIEIEWKEEREDKNDSSRKTSRS